MFQIHYCPVAAVPQVGLGHGEEGGQVLQAGEDEAAGTVHGPAVTPAGDRGESSILGTGSSKQSL